MSQQDIIDLCTREQTKWFSGLDIMNILDNSSRGAVNHALNKIRKHKLLLFKLGTFWSSARGSTRKQQYYYSFKPIDDNEAITKLTNKKGVFD